MRSTERPHPAHPPTTGRKATAASWPGSRHNPRQLSTRFHLAPAIDQSARHSTAHKQRPCWHPNWTQWMAVAKKRRSLSHRLAKHALTAGAICNEAEDARAAVNGVHQSQSRWGIVGRDTARTHDHMAGRLKFRAACSSNPKSEFQKRFEKLAMPDPLVATSIS